MFPSSLQAINSMDYDYEQNRTQFEDNIVAYNGAEEEDDYYDDTQRTQQMGGAGHARKLSLNHHNRDSSSSFPGLVYVGLLFRFF